MNIFITQFPVFWFWFIRDAISHRFLQYREDIITSVMGNTSVLLNQFSCFTQFLLIVFSYFISSYDRRCKKFMFLFFLFSLLLVKYTSFISYVIDPFNDSYWKKGSKAMQIRPHHSFRYPQHGTELFIKVAGANTIRTAVVMSAMQKIKQQPFFFCF